ncbi:hypothetical protein DFS34DRAFT_668358 [Phlyctochytrium arcticum]|nr:hypothetical protein DFS34DRAFT_668358 [Phlyctochytrium arcticum]
MAWRAAAELGSLIFVHQINNLDQYIHTLRNATHQFFIATGNIAPDLFGRRKYHMLVHLLKTVRTFGPARGTESQKFESYNGVTREQIIHTNWQYPSRDVAAFFINYRTVRHIFCGGFWKEGDHCTRGGDGLHELFDDQSMQELLGFKKSYDNEGKTTLGSMWGKRDKHPVPFSSTEAYQRGCIQLIRGTGKFMRWRRLTLDDGGKCHPNIIVGLREILAKWILVQPYELTHESHLGCPILRDSPAFVLLPPSQIIGIANMQHHCSAVGCGMQTVDNALGKSTTWTHKDESVFVFNRFAGASGWVRAHYPHMIEPVNMQDAAKDIWRNWEFELKAVAVAMAEKKVENERKAAECLKKAEDKKKAAGPKRQKGIHASIRPDPQVFHAPQDIIFRQSHAFSIPTSGTGSIYHVSIHQQPVPLSKSLWMVLMADRRHKWHQHWVPNVDGNARASLHQLAGNLTLRISEEETWTTSQE